MTATRAARPVERKITAGLLARLTDLVARYVRRQADAGADAVQLFDTWAGILSLADWTRLVRPHLARLIDETSSLGIPRILFVQDASHLVPAYAALGAEALSVDWREDLGCLRTRLGSGVALQGNLDPAILLGGARATADATRALLSRVPSAGHIVNLGHGILPETPLESVQSLLDVVHAEAAA